MTTTDPAFIPGRVLAAAFYHEAVAPILSARFHGLVHSAALIDHGSEVLGYDTPLSRDHHWGPRLLLFLSEAAIDSHAPAVIETLRWRLPLQFRGYPTHFADADEDGVQHLAARRAHPVDHRVEVHTVGGFFRRQLGCDPRDGLTVLDWLSFPSQELRLLTGGPVFHDGLNELTAARAALGWYPDDVWRHLMAAGWGRIAEEEAFMGRCGDVGDELGSLMVAGRLVRDIMRLCFLMERQYAPYLKWFGTAFAHLKAGPELMPILRAALAAPDWHPREAQLSRALERLAERHNALGLTPPLETRVSSYHGRPYQVIHAGRFAAALRAGISNPDLRAIPDGLGGVDQVTDCTPIQERVAHRRALAGLYRPPEDDSRP